MSKVIKTYIKNLDYSPGVYRMLNAKGQVLYVGKAKNLKKRVSQYLQTSKLPIRLQRMVFETAAMEFITTASETEALLLEVNLIKKLRPKYNILLRDDKNFSFIGFTSEHKFPQIKKLRTQAARESKFNSFGPFASNGAIDKTIVTLQKIFKLRSCSDHEFSQRIKPCLKYHIKRCSGPCVNYISIDDYNQQLSQAQQVLMGKSSKVHAHLTKLMVQASEAQSYEKAAIYRDRIQSLNLVQSEQNINVREIKGNFHVVALYRGEGSNNICIQVFFYNNGMHYGNHPFYPKNCELQSDSEVMGEFLKMFYAQHKVPDFLLISHQLLAEDDKNWQLLVHSQQKIKKCQLSVPKLGRKKKLIDYAIHNAKLSCLQGASFTDVLEELQMFLGLDRPLKHIEVYDNSHIMGTHALSAMVVVRESGFDKKSYRRYNMTNLADKNTKKGDDYAMMRKVMQRRLAPSSSSRNSLGLPDLIILDGGRGQLSVAKEVLDNLGLIDEIAIMAIAKGVERNSGNESIYLGSEIPSTPKKIDDKPNLLKFLQNIRDEAHRFVITGHRRQRDKAMTASSLDDVPGIGVQKRKMLLQHFGSIKAISGASCQDLAKVSGISPSLAKEVYDHFHSN